MTVTGVTMKWTLKLSSQSLLSHWNTKQDGHWKEYLLSWESDPRRKEMGVRSTVWMRDRVMS